jgi:hypothetical protein
VEEEEIKKSALQINILGRSLGRKIEGDMSGMCDNLFGAMA